MLQYNGPMCFSICVGVCRRVARQTRNRRCGSLRRVFQLIHESGEKWILTPQMASDESRCCASTCGEMPSATRGPTAKTCETSSALWSGWGLQSTMRSARGEIEDSGFSDYSGGRWKCWEMDEKCSCRQLIYTCAAVAFCEKCSLYLTRLFIVYVRKSK